MDYVIGAALIIAFAAVVALISVALRLSKLTNPAPGGWLSQFVFALFGAYIGELIGLSFNAGPNSYGVYWIPVVILALLAIIFGTPAFLHWPSQPLTDEQRAQLAAMTAKAQANPAPPSNVSLSQIKRIEEQRAQAQAATPAPTNRLTRSASARSSASRSKGRRPNLLPANLPLANQQPTQVPQMRPRRTHDLQHCPITDPAAAASGAPC